MSAEQPPFVVPTADGPVDAPLCRPLLDPAEGLGGRLKDQPEDFEVEEIPAYAPCGDGEHLFLWIEKRDVSASQLKQVLAEQLGVPQASIGMAGLKDRRAVTRQFVSVPADVEPRLSAFAHEGISVLSASRHGNKLKTGHLHGNRFNILVREPLADAEQRLPQRVQQIRRTGVPNYYGTQRFGRSGSTVSEGLQLLIAQRDESSRRRVGRGHRLRFLLSAVQSLVFNQVLDDRLRDGILDQALPGDVLLPVRRKWAFVSVEDPAEANQQLADGTAVLSGPLFGPRMYAASGAIEQRELNALDKFRLELSDFRRFPKLTPGGRRPLVVRVDDLEYETTSDGIRFRFTLPSGCYATVVLSELMGDSSGDSIDDAGRSLAD